MTRYLRILFVSLIAIGVCGGVYVGLTFGLAAYMRYQGSLIAEASEADAATAAPSAKPAASPDADAAAAQKPAADPIPAMEDAASVLRRTWTAPRHGLTSPPITAAPVDDRKRIVPVGTRLWSPVSLESARPKFIVFPHAQARAPIPAGDLAPVPVNLMLAPPQEITFPAAPPVKASTPSIDRVPLGAVAADRTGDRPATTDDPTARPGEALLLQKAPPSRSAPASPERLAIPEPNPYATSVRTELPEDSLPLTPPDRPEPVVFPTK